MLLAQAEQDDLGPPALFDEPLELTAGTKRKRRLPKRFVDHVPSTSNSTVLPTTSLPHLLDLVPPDPVNAEHEIEPMNMNIEPGELEPYSTDLDSHFELRDLVRPYCASEISDPFTTPATDYGVYRIYPNKPKDDPDESLVLEDFCESPDLAVAGKEERQPSLPQVIANKYFPFKNAANFIFSQWQNNGVTNKSDDQMNKLAKELSTNPDVVLDDLQGYNAKRERDRLVLGIYIDHKIKLFD